MTDIHTVVYHVNKTVVFSSCQFCLFTIKISPSFYIEATLPDVVCILHFGIVIVNNLSEFAIMEAICFRIFQCTSVYFNPRVFSFCPRTFRDKRLLSYHFLKQ